MKAIGDHGSEDVPHGSGPIGRIDPVFVGDGFSCRRVWVIVHVEYMDARAGHQPKFGKVRSPFVKMVDIGEDACLGVIRSCGHVQHFSQMGQVLGEPPNLELRSTVIAIAQFEQGSVAFRHAIQVELFSVGGSCRGAAMR